MRSLLLFFLLAACAHAPRRVNPDRWHELESDHFTLRTDASLEQAQAMMGRLERVRAVMLATVWKGVNPPSERMQVLAFSDRADLRSIAGNDIAGMVGRDAFGEPLIVANTDSEDAYAILQHELVHRLAVHFFVRQPRWLAEGLACYLETIRFNSSGRAVVGESSRHRLDYLNWTGLPDYHRVLSMGREYLTAGEQGYAFESQSWVLVHWLLNHDAAGLSEFLRRIVAGEHDDKAFAESFPRLSIDDLGGMLFQYVRRGTYRSVVVATPQWQGQVSVYGVPPAEVYAARAYLMRMWNKPESAVQAELALALRADPANPLALLVSRATDGTQAVRAHPNDWRAWVVLARTKDGDLAALEKAAQLAPENAGVLSSLGAARARAGEVDDGIRLALRAVQKEPGRSDFLALLSGMLAGTGRCDEAATVAERALEVVPDGEKAVVAKYQELLDGAKRRCTASSQPVLAGCHGDGPAISARERVPGVVSADVVVGVDGSVHGVTVSGDASPSVLAAVKQYVESCRYTPATRAGKPVGARVQEQFDFSRR